jgi:hypothetical protein
LVDRAVAAAAESWRRPRRASRRWAGWHNATEADKNNAFKLFTPRESALAASAAPCITEEHKDFVDYEPFEHQALHFATDPTELEGVWNGLPPHRYQVWLYNDGMPCRKGYFGRLARVLIRSKWVTGRAPSWERYS